MTLREAIQLLVERIDLSEDEMASCMAQIMEGKATDAQIGAFLSALRMKGETVGEITGAVRIMHDKALKIKAPEGVIDLSLRSEVGRGSMFSVQLEVTARPAPAPADETAPASPASLVGGTVLCVDNEQAILDGMQTLLERWGVRVLRASTAEEARSAFMQHSPDVVLADYRLGDDDCDGLELLQSLRVGGVSHAPAALVTADHGAGVAERARVLGYKVLRKPVKPAALRGLLGALLAMASRG